jgi:imidazole glycerol-phosphate synthase subunit HisH
MFEIGIVDYGMGNLRSVYSALEAIGATPVICQEAQDLSQVDKIILPGVGAIGDCIHNLKNRGFVEVLNHQVLEKGKPILGICLGMQVMAKCSYEGGHYECLDWFNAEVVRLEPSDLNLRVPHVGWNNINYSSGSILFANLPASPDVYFVHSYHMQCSDSQDEIANCEYGGNVTVAVQKRNIMAVQFHPEKSQDYGLTILENFLRWQS